MLQQICWDLRPNVSIVAEMERRWHQERLSTDPYISTSKNRLFAWYQLSEFRKCIWHSLNHIPADLMGIGNMHCIQDALSERAHNLIYQHYQVFSKRTYTVIAETINLQNMTSSLAFACALRYNVNWIAVRVSHMEAHLVTALDFV